MLLKFTQEFFLQVVPEWYVPEVLSGEGTLEEQICEYERNRAEKDGMYFASLKQGATTVVIVLDDTAVLDEIALEDNVENSNNTESISQQETSVLHSDNSQEREGSD